MKSEIDFSEIQSEKGGVLRWLLLIIAVVLIGGGCYLFFKGEFLTISGEEVIIRDN